MEFTEKCLFASSKKNLNGRIYSPETLDNIIKEFKESETPMYGELGMPESSVIDLSKVTHQVLDIKSKHRKLPRKKKKELKKKDLYESWLFKNKDLYATIKFLDNDLGNLAKNSIKSKLAVVRPRGIGFVDGNGLITSFSLISFNVVPKSDDSFKNF